MFTQEITVPRITRAQFIQMNQMVPGLSDFASIPVIETAEKAEQEAVRVVNKRLATSEYVARCSSIAEEESGWTFTFLCLGD